jgi:hypothetical protein
MHTKTFFLASAMASASACQSFTLSKVYDASNFFDGFDFRSAEYYDELNPEYQGDPTHGSVLYLNRTAAEDAGLVWADDKQIYIGVDYSKVAAPLGRGTDRHGRESVRLESKITYSSGLLIADIHHMPGTACGVWPSL